MSVKIEEKGKTTVGQAADTDTLVASANAYINALNKMIIIFISLTIKIIFIGLYLMDHQITFLKS